MSKDIKQNDIYNNQLNKKDKFTVSFQTSRYNGLTLSEELDIAQRLCLPAFEIFFDGVLPTDLTEAEKNRIKSLQNAGMKFSVHAPIRDYFDFDEVCLSLCDFCNFLRPEFMTVHFDRLSDKVISDFEKHLESAVLSVENVIPDDNALTHDDYVTFITKISKKHNVRATVDIGHLFVNGFEPIEYVSRILQNDVQIACFHIHNNDGKTDSHQSLPDGKINYGEVLKFLFDNEICARYVIEHWTDNEKSLNFFCKIRNLY